MRNVPARLLLYFLVLCGFPDPCPVSAHSESADEIRLDLRVEPDRVTETICQVSIEGTLTTPSSTGGATDWKLASTGKFRFRQRQQVPEVPGVNGLRAVRRYVEAGATTVVGDEHRTVTQLPSSHHQLQVYGADTVLLHVSPAVRMARKHVDLLQLPCDPLAAAGLVPSRPLASSDEKWNADPWVLPMLIGLDGVVSQSVSCEISQISDTVAVVQFRGEAEGASLGAAVTASLSGQFTINRVDGLISELQALLKQKSSPGVVSPGLDVSVTVSWTQKVAEDEALLQAELPPPTEPEPAGLLLTLATPWRLALLHNRNWHLFHETADLVMLRLLEHGALIGQCNIGPAPTVAAGESTSEDVYRQEVAAAIASRGGSVAESEVFRTESGWRVHHVRALTETNPPAASGAVKDTVYWDYYLCTWKTGEQFALAFTHTRADDARFGSADRDILNTLVILQNRQKLPLPR